MTTTTHCMDRPTEDQLRLDLRTEIERRYGDTERTWADAGCMVHKVVSMAPKNDGRHLGEVLFLVTRNGATREYTTLYAYVSRVRHEPAHWYMQRDWND